MKQGLRKCGGVKPENAIQILVYIEGKQYHLCETRGEGVTIKIITLNCLHIYYDLEEYLAIIIMIEGTINYKTCKYNVFNLYL